MKWSPEGLVVAIRESVTQSKCESRVSSHTMLQGSKIGIHIWMALRYKEVAGVYAAHHTTTHNLFYTRVG